MAAFETLIRYRAEWEKYEQDQNAGKLLEAARFVLNEFNQTDRRTTAQSWLELPVETMHDCARTYEDYPARATKSELAEYLARKSQESERMHRKELQEKVQALEAGRIPDEIVQFLITALDTYIW